jgi:glycosyltransferase involved in cell wall biosynthesis
MRAGASSSIGRGLRILVISPWKNRWSLGPGAGVSDDHHFISELARAGVELHFLSPHGRDDGDSSPDLYVRHTYPNFFDATSWWPTFLKRLVWPPIFAWLVSWRAFLVARIVRPDFVLGHSHYGAIPAFVCKTFLRVPCGVKLFGVMDLVHTEWPRWKYYFKNIEQIVALKVPQDLWIILDDGTRGRDAAIRHGVSAEKIRFLPNGVNVEWLDHAYDCAEARRRWDIPLDAKVVLFLARLVDSKRPAAVVSAIPKVRAFVQRPLFIFVGDGPERARCAALAERLHVADSVRMLGVVPQADVPLLMAACDVFVSTSRLTNAAIPTCEAMVCERPVVVFDVGDTRIIREGGAGLVVPDGDVAALAQAVAGLMGDAAMRHSFGKAARAYAAKHFVGWTERIAMELDAIAACARNAPAQKKGTSR